MRECGLKQLMQLHQLLMLQVTPHAGVWIETKKISCSEKSRLVTPHAGVWIETDEN